jgi:3-oxoacyl-[acyl-carrier-protein] synthase II
MRAASRVALTGVGTVNALAAGGSLALAAALDGRRPAAAPVQAFPIEGCRSRLAAEVPAAVLASLVEPEQARRLSRVSQLAVAACRLAVEDARLDPRPADLGIALGTEFGDFRSTEAFASGFLRRGPAGLSPMIFPNTVMNAMAAAAAIAVGARGPTITLNQSTLAGDLAVARGAALVAHGRAGAVVAGGVDELCETVYCKLADAGLISPMGGAGPEGCRPYAPDHNGPVLGEGATFVVLEPLAAARARGAPIHAEIVVAGWGNVPSAPHRACAWRRDPRALARRTLEASGTDPRALDGCLGSGNGDPDLDDWERALLVDELGGDDGRAWLDPPRSLAPLFGQHGGLGALRVAAAARDAARSGRPSLVHGMARGGCRTVIVVGPAG